MLACHLKRLSANDFLRNIGDALLNFFRALFPQKIIVFDPNLDSEHLTFLCKCNIQ
jgi:hypothetical protein